MMNLADFKRSLAAANPPANLTVSLQALWQDAKGNWQAAHALVQAHEDDVTCNWVHAYLHRKEGDLPNAGYWYRSVNKPVFKDSLEEEWAAISADLLAAAVR
jgi:hypothetical protein